VKKALQGFGSKRIAAMADMLAKAQEAGEIRAELEPDKLATQLMVTLAGAAAMVKGILDGAELRKVLSEMIDSWT
jgi:TetR/AcrR family transcriptional repressor of nem operon